MGLWSAAVLVLAAWLAGCAAPPPEPGGTAPATPPAVPAPAAAARPAPPVVIEVAAVGDLMLGTDYPEPRLPPPGLDLLGPAAPLLRAADIAVGNLEGVILAGGEPAKACADPARCWLFRMPPGTEHLLAAAGFDALSLANNHARDFGEAGRAATMAALDAAGIRHSGAEGDVASWTVKGRRVAFIAFAPFRGAHNLLDLEAAIALVAELAAAHDIVVVSMHAGAEGAGAGHLPFAEEFYHGEHRGDVVAFARAMVVAGADLVLGHGPHVPRALELHSGRLIAYSLGNFCTYWGVNVQGPNGLAPLLLVRLDGEGRFLGGRIVSFRQRRPHGPLPDPAGGAARRMGDLARADLPQTGVVPAPDGTLRPPPAAPPADKGPGGL